MKKNSAKVAVVNDGEDTLMKGIKLIEDELAILKATTPQGSPAPVADQAPAKKTKSSITTTPIEDDDENEDDGPYAGIAYAQLKKLAKEKGLSGAGTREELIQRLTDADDEEEEEPKKASKKTSEKETKNKKSSKKVEEEDDEDDEVEEDDSDLYSKVKKEIKDMSDEEIADFLTNCGIRPAGKRTALIDLVVKAYKKGLATFEDEDEDEDNEEEVTTKKSSKKSSSKKEEKASKKSSKAVKEEVEEVEEADEEDNINDFDNPAMTEERAAAMKSFRKQTMKEYKSKKLTDEEVKNFLLDYFEGDKDTIKEIKKADKADLLETYIDIYCRFIDDEGNVSEDDECYSLNGEYAHCGMLLSYDEDKEAFICPRCETEFPVEDDEE